MNNIKKWIKKNYPYESFIKFEIYFYPKEIQALKNE